MIIKKIIFDYIIKMLANISVWISIVVIAIIAYFVFIKFFKKEKFTMALYRPQHVTSLPAKSVDPASFFSAALPSMKFGPQLVTEKGDYRRFQRV